LPAFPKGKRILALNPKDESLEVKKSQPNCSEGYKNLAFDQKYWLIAVTLSFSLDGTLEARNAALIYSASPAPK